MTTNVTLNYSVPMPKYDILLNYLAKNQTISLDAALSLLEDYPLMQSRYTTINRLVQRKVLERTTVQGIPSLRLQIKERAIKPNRKKGIDSKYDLKDWASLYRFFVRYGAQHFTAHGRINFMTIMRAWLDTQKDYIQFIEMLEELIENPPSLKEFMELEKGLKAAGWYDGDYDSADLIDSAIGILNPDRVNDFLGYSNETWHSLRDVDGLGRVNITAQPSKNPRSLLDPNNINDRNILKLLDEGPEPDHNYSWTGVYITDWLRGLEKGTEEYALVVALGEQIKAVRNGNTEEH